MAPSQLQNEILEQPARLKYLLETESGNINKVATAIRERAPRYIMLAARGSSDNAGRYGQYLFGAHTRLPVALATPSLFTLYQAPPNLKDALVLAISQSGQSPDIRSVVEAGRRQGALTVAITNDPASPLASIAKYCIDLHSGAEQSVAATKTYTASLLALAMLSTALTGDPALSGELARVPAFVAKTLLHADEVISAATAYRDVEACVVIGRGYNYSTAFEIALKLKELTYTLAEPYSSADFQHGPVALVQDGFPVVAIIPAGKTASELTRFLREIETRRPRLVVISSLKSALAFATTAIPLPAGIPEWLSPIMAVIPGQLFSLGLATTRGLNPDQPRGLDKVTKTR